MSLSSSVNTMDFVKLRMRSPMMFKRKMKNSQKIGCGCYIRKIGVWYIHSWKTERNHPIPKIRDIYAKYRVQPGAVETKIKTLFESGLNYQAAFNALQAEGIDNVIKKDLENMYDRVVKSKNDKTYDHNYWTSREKLHSQLHHQ
ncbi:hypothetical protein BCV72DRAFT_323098 [Rhizopus microsporus var. microsporus]|uniref:Uncharacterized protein n=2 Tax=Rhizopus microsporus TaxID=58291 RepID=A0A2G4SME5_RHIZD|nr:uncharacterized protein RHIMIDRAFT_299414 [Rhizopus microsporus ATCC 52813]ORE01109.1 hypothetical protein BCV72DRAFT_323098 [Rhizopus microsporus var. microsporus]PHZ09912.1 hypothetical protein RHIMIDRAFT_299414 [Rhizopus microsporus ATCC 52813]